MPRSICSKFNCSARNAFFWGKVSGQRFGKHSNDRGVQSIPWTKPYDVFICHAGEDKDEVARPLAERLRGAGLSVWYDEFSLKVGESLRQSVERGLSSSRFGAVVLSQAFFAKKWPQAELNGLFSKELIGDKTILPIWHRITHEEIVGYSPILADRFAATTGQGLDVVLGQLLDAIEPAWRHTAARGRAVAISPTSVQLYAGQWAVTTPVVVMNQGDMPVYAVSIKVVVSGENVSASSVKFDLAPQVLPMDMVVGDIVFSADCVGLAGTDEHGRQCLMYFLHTILPRASQTFSLTGTVPVPSTAEISVLGFEDAPKGLLARNGNEVAAVFTPKESFKVAALLVKMRRREPTQ